MNWNSVINNPILRDLPFKIELDKWGKILMSPANNTHGNLQFEVGMKVKEALQGSGKIIMECSIQTSQGVKVADVAWASEAFIAEYGFQTPYSKAPELCIEIVSPLNAKAEMEEKIELYLAKGAQEVWLVYNDGLTEYYAHEGKIEHSRVLDSK